MAELIFFEVQRRAWEQRGQMEMGVVRQTALTGWSKVPGQVPVTWVAEIWRQVPVLHEDRGTSANELACNWFNHTTCSLSERKWNAQSHCHPQTLLSLLCGLTEWAWLKKERTGSVSPDSLKTQNIFHYCWEFLKNWCLSNSDLQATQLAHWNLRENNINQKRIDLLA